MLPPANLGKKQNVSNCASCYRINSHHPTDHDWTLLRLQLHWLCGLRSSQNHRTLLEFICFAFGNNQWDVQSLSKLSRMYVVWLMFIAGLWHMMWWFGNFGANKTKSSNRKAQYGTSYPTHLTRLEEQMKTVLYPPYIGMALKLCTCRLFTRTTCSLLLPGLELNMTFRPYKVCSFHSDIKTSLQLRSMGWKLANLSVTTTIGPLPLWRCRPPVRVFCTI